MRWLEWVFPSVCRVALQEERAFSKSVLGAQDRLLRELREATERIERQSRILAAEIRNHEATKAAYQADLQRLDAWWSNWWSARKTDSALIVRARKPAKLKRRKR